jgi:hypothetical protein
MKLPHGRRFLHLAASAAALPAVSRFAWAQTYPIRPVRIIVGFPPGQPADISARLLSQWLLDRLGAIENPTGRVARLRVHCVLHWLALAAGQARLAIQLVLGFSGGRSSKYSGWALSTSARKADENCSATFSRCAPCSVFFKISSSAASNAFSTAGDRRGS